MNDKAPFDEVPKTTEQVLLLARSFPKRCEMIRNFLVSYAPLVPHVSKSRQGMGELLQQVGLDVLKVQTEYGGNFPQAIGEARRQPVVKEPEAAPTENDTQDDNNE